MAIEVKRSVCPFDCPDACGLIMTVENGKIIAVKGDEDHPYTRGQICGKMSLYHQTIYAKDRLLQPLRRSGPKGSGQFEPISWEEALALIAQRWKTLIRDHGSEAILPYSYAGTMGMLQTNAGHAFFHKIGASRLIRTICSPAKGAGWEALMGKTQGMDPKEAAFSDYIIIWGLNAIATNHHFIQDLKVAKARGAKVVLIETYHTPTAALADEVILVKPGTDGALALGIMHMLKALGYVDQAFIAKSVLGYEKFSQEILPQYDLEKVALITGVSAAIIRKLAEEYGKAQASYIQIGSGMSRYGNGAMTVRTISLLPALTGAWQVCGGGCFNSTSMKQAFAAEAITREDFMEETTRMINMNQLGRALCEEKPPIYSLYVYNCNPAAVCPDQNRVIEGLLREDLFTVVHERFMTDTAKLADVILPATTSAEHSDFYRAYGHHYLQRSYPVIAPLGDSKANWDVFCLLAKYMGIEDPFFAQSADALIDHVWEIPTKLRDGLELRRWQEGKAVPPNLAQDFKLDFKTPSGKIEIYNDQLAEPMPRYIPPYGGEGTLHLVIAPSVYTLNSTFTEQQRLRQRRGNMTLLMNEVDAKARQIKNGDRIEVHNPWGSAQLIADVRPGKVLAGTVVAEGVWRLEDTLSGRSVNALLSPNLTDLGEGSTLSDNCVEIRRLAHDGTGAKEFNSN